MVKQPEEILLFWFSDAIKPLWFDSDLTFDEEVRKLFEDTYELAKKGDLDEWKEQPDTILPLILLLDQVPRHIYRNKKEAFASDEKALECTKYAIEQGYDKNMSVQERMFLYMPLMHSEDPEIQEMSVAYYKHLGLESSYDFAIQHKRIVDTYGRFPHRNIVLERESTDQEQEFLLQPGSSF